VLRLHEQANTKTLTLKHFTDLFFFSPLTRIKSHC